MLITAAILGILAFPLVFLGLRGRRVDDHAWDVLADRRGMTILRQIGADQHDLAAEKRPQ